MTPEQITAVGSVCVAAVTAASAALYRYTSRAGRTIRKLRAGLEDAIEYGYRVRRVAIAAGVLRHELPRIPRSLIELEAWQPDSDFTEDGERL